MSLFTAFAKRAGQETGGGTSAIPPSPKAPASPPVAAPSPSPATPGANPPTPPTGNPSPTLSTRPPVSAPNSSTVSPATVAPSPAIKPLAHPVLGLGSGLQPSPTRSPQVQKPRLNLQGTYTPSKLGDPPSSGSDVGKMLGHLAPALFPMVAPHVGKTLGLPGLFALSEATNGTDHLSTIFGPDKDPQPFRASHMGQAAALGLGSGLGSSLGPLGTPSTTRQSSMSHTNVPRQRAYFDNVPEKSELPESQSQTSIGGEIPSIQQTGTWAPWKEIAQRNNWKPGNPDYDKVIEYARSQGLNPNSDQVKQIFFDQAKSRWAAEQAGYRPGSTKFQTLQAELAAKTPGGPAPSEQDVWDYAAEKGLIDPTRTDDNFGMVQDARSKDTSTAGHLVQAILHPQSMAPVAAPVIALSKIAPGATSWLAKKPIVNNALTRGALPLGNVMKKVPIMGAGLDLFDRYVGAPTGVGGRGLGEGMTSIEEDTSRFDNLVNNKDRTMGGYLYELFNNPVSSGLTGNAVLNNAQELGRAAAQKQYQLDTVQKARSAEKVEQLKAIPQRTPGQEADYQAAQANLRESDMDSWFKGQGSWSDRLWHDMAGRDFSVPGFTDRSVYLPGTSIPINPLAGTGAGRGLGDATRWVGRRVSDAQDNVGEMLKPVTNVAKRVGEKLDRLTEPGSPETKWDIQQAKEQASQQAQRVLEDAGLALGLQQLADPELQQRAATGRLTPADNVLLERQLSSLDFRKQKNLLDSRDQQLVQHLLPLTRPGTVAFQRLKELEKQLTPQVARSSGTSGEAARERVQNIVDDAMTENLPGHLLPDDMRKRNRYR